MNEPSLQVHPRLRSIELRRVILLGLGGLVMGGGMASFAIWRAWDVLANFDPGDAAIVAASAFVAGLIAYGTWREMRVSLDRVALTASLAQAGEPVIVDVLASRKDNGGFRVMFRYTFRTPAGVVHEAGIAISEGGAYRVAESERKSLALLSRDGRQVLLLTRSGYPLINAAEALARASASAR